MRADQTARVNLWQHVTNECNNTLSIYAHHLSRGVDGLGVVTDGVARACTDRSDLESMCELWAHLQ